jgi:uncharacterized protein (UPF0179 family)
VVEIKDRVLECPEDFHKEPMRLVRLEKPELKASMHNKDIYEGSIINFVPVSCDRMECSYIDYCEPHKLLLHKGKRVKVEKVLEKIDKCPRGFHLSVVKMKSKDK